MKNKIKIYFFHPYSGFGGADLSISRLINGLDSKYFDIDFLSINYPNISNKILKKIQYRRIYSSRTIFSFKKIRQIIENDKNYKKKSLFQTNILQMFSHYFF